MEEMEARPEVRGFFLTHYYYVPFLFLAGIGVLVAALIGMITVDMAVTFAAFAVIVIYSAVTLIHSKLHYDTTKLTANEEQVVYETGILHHMRKKIPVHMITDTTVDRPLYERILGLSTLCVSTAGSTGNDVEAHCIPHAAAKEFHSKLYHLINKVKEKTVLKTKEGQKVEEEVTDMGLMKRVFNYKPKIDLPHFSRKK